MHNSNNSALSKDIIFGVKNHTNINPTFNIPSSLEELSVSKAKEVLTKNLLAPREEMQVLSNLEAAKEATEEATEIFNHRNNVKLPANITETPKFHEVKGESVELSDSAKETFARIGERAKRESLTEEIEALKKQFKQTFVKQQTRRARKYNIPFDASRVDYHQLSSKIDQYDFLLDEAKRWDIFWDTKIYDPVALEQEQELEDARSRYWEESRLTAKG